MNASVATPIRLTCDVLKCAEVLDTGVTIASLAVAFGRKQGWLCTDVADYCPTHSGGAK